MHVVGDLVEGGESLAAITSVIQSARERLQVDFPLSNQRFSSEIASIIDGLIREGTRLEASDCAHVRKTVRNKVPQFFETIEFGENGEPIRHWPKNGHGRIVLDAGRQRGKPIDAATGVPTWAIYAATRAGGGQAFQEVAKWFNVPMAAIEAAVEFEESLAT